MRLVRSLPVVDALREKTRGQILVMFALLLPTMVALVGLGVDAAFTFGQDRAAQSAADLAALAGATELPYAPAVAKAQAAAIGTENRFTNGVASTSVAITTPYVGGNTKVDSTEKIEVRISRPSPTFFIRVLGVSSLTVSARALAYNEPTGYALFATKTSCSNEALTVSGSTEIVEGKVHSNSGLKLNGSSNRFKSAVTHVCGKEQSGSGLSFGSGPSATGTQPVPHPPGNFDANSFTCNKTVSSGYSVQQSDITNQTICVTDGEIKIDTSNLSGRITLVAKGTNGKLDISGQGTDLKPASNGNNVLLYSEGSSDDAIKIQGSDQKFGGIIYAKNTNGRVYVSGSNHTMAVMIVGGRIDLAGSGMNIKHLEGGKRRAGLIE